MKQRSDDEQADATAQPDDGGGRRRARGSTAVHEDLREDILSLRIAPGSPLDEVALGERFGLSRTPIREALLMLAGEDLVTFLHGRSPIVTPHDLGNTREYMDTLVLLSRAIVRLASEVSNAQALDEIRTAAVAYEEAVKGDDIQAIAMANLAFHRAISFATGNQFLGKFYRLSLDYGRRMNLLHYYPLFDAAERSLTVAQHNGLAEAIGAGDAEAAEAIASDHVVAELRVIQRSLEPKMGARFSLKAGWRIE
ncbi:MAG: GntR family transcriptional regulator [Ancalomicrobiaceae bacterium]|nr:GntR family transcriptional regulator [Ancalomicrobiaceae bacterium]